MSEPTIQQLNDLLDQLKVIAEGSEHLADRAAKMLQATEDVDGSGFSLGFGDFDQGFGTLLATFYNPGKPGITYVLDNFQFWGSVFSAQKFESTLDSVSKLTLPGFRTIRSNGHNTHYKQDQKSSVSVNVDQCPKKDKKSSHTTHPHHHSCRAHHQCNHC